MRTYLLLRCDLEQQLHGSRQVLEVFDQQLGWISNGSICREGLLQHNVQLFDVHGLRYDRMKDASFSHTLNSDYAALLQCSK
jgi:hypothetical protein